MTISKRVQKELFSAAPAGLLLVSHPKELAAAKGKRQVKGPKKTKAERTLAAAIADENKGKAWTDEEHERFLEALKEYPSGPWKAIADFVGTKNSRQTMTHAQKYRQKHERRARGLRNRSKHRKAARMAPKSKPAAAFAPPSTTHTSTSTARTRSQTSVRVHDDVVVPSTPDKMQTSASQFSDSPRSSEEGAGITYLTPLTSESLMGSTANTDANAADDDDASWEQLKISSISEMFQDFEPMNFLPTMWSTNSLGDVDMIAASHSTNELFSDSVSANPLSLWG